MVDGKELELILHKDDQNAAGMPLLQGMGHKVY
jgi:hypothetical protein